MRTVSDASFVKVHQPPAHSTASSRNTCVVSLVDIVLEEEEEDDDANVLNDVTSRITAPSTMRVRSMRVGQQVTTLFTSLALIMRSKMCLSPGVVDARSDTVTKPTPAMRDAMRDAIVGDDVLGDDLTVKQLEAKVAAIFGYPAAVFVPSGTMANLLAISTWCDERGSEVIVGSKSHVHLYEQGGIATIGGAHPRAVPNASDGTMALGDIEDAIRQVRDDHFPVTKAVCLENTHNKTGGKVLSCEYVRSVAALCAQFGVKVHMDGARIWNAAVALGKSPGELVVGCDSVSVCLSKAIGAPVGSVLCGPVEFIQRAKRFRKALGGSMRQVGVLAAPALVAIDEVFPKLRSDHILAQSFAKSLAGAPGIECLAPDSNMVLVTVTVPGITADAVVRELEESHGVLVLPWSARPAMIRVVFHHQITQSDVERLVKGFRQSLEDLARDPKLDEIMMAEGL